MMGSIDRLCLSSRCVVCFWLRLVLRVRYCGLIRLFNVWLECVISSVLGLIVLSSKLCWLMM